MDVTATELREAGFDPQFGTLEGAVAEHLAGTSTNVAVVGEPFAGRETLLDHVEDRLDAVRRISLSDVVTADEPMEFGYADAVAVDDCHYLYMRQIGGFERLDRFLERIAMSDTLFVTSWNRYAWDYLAAVRDVAATFPVTVHLPHLNATQTTKFLRSVYGPDLPAFVQTSHGGRVKTVNFDEYEVSLPGTRSVGVPVPELQTEYLSSWSNTEADDVQAVVFEKIAKRSLGNPGVAMALWEHGVRNGEIAPAYVTEVDDSITLDEDEAFLLEVVLAKETVSRSALESVLAIPVDRTLQSLTEQGVLAVDGDVVSLVPERMHAAVEHLRGRRWMW